MRDGYRLTEAAQAQSDEFRALYGDGNCSCHISPPCDSCTHPGNPRNLDEDDEAWVKITSCEGCFGNSFDTRQQCAGCENFSNYEVA